MIGIRPSMMIDDLDPAPALGRKVEPRQAPTVAETQAREARQFEQGDKRLLPRISVGFSNYGLLVPNPILQQVPAAAISGGGDLQTRIAHLLEENKRLQARVDALIDERNIQPTIEYLDVANDARLVDRVQQARVADGWIKHDGKGAPPGLREGARVEFVCRNGYTENHVVRVLADEADNWFDWARSAELVDSVYDIVAYRAAG